MRMILRLRKFRRRRGITLNRLLTFKRISTHSRNLRQKNSSTKFNAIINLNDANNRIIRTYTTRQLNKTFNATNTNQTNSILRSIRQRNRLSTTIIRLSSRHLQLKLIKHNQNNNAQNNNRKNQLTKNNKDQYTIRMHTLRPLNKRNRQVTVLNNRIIITRSLLRRQGQHKRTFSRRLIGRTTRANRNVRAILNNSSSLTRRQVRLQKSNITLFRANVSTRTKTNQPLSLLRHTKTKNRINNQIFTNSTRFRTITTQFKNTNRLTANNSVRLFTRRIRTTSLFKSNIFRLRAQISFRRMRLTIQNRRRFTNPRTRMTSHNRRTTKMFLRHTSSFLKRRKHKHLFRGFLITALRQTIANKMRNRITIQITPKLNLSITYLIRRLLSRMFLRVTTLRHIIIRMRTTRLLIIVRRNSTITTATVDTLRRSQMTINIYRIRRHSRINRQFKRTERQQRFNTRNRSTNNSLITRVRRHNIVQARPSNANILSLLHRTQRFKGRSVTEVRNIHANLTRSISRRVLIRMHILMNITKRRMYLINRIRVTTVTILFKMSNRNKSARLLNHTRRTGHGLTSIHGRRFFSDVDRDIGFYFLCERWNGPHSRGDIRTLL